MTQPNNSAHNPLPRMKTKRFARSLPAQSICWLSSLSLLGSGFVVAQTETSIDNIVPTIENSQPTQPAVITNPVKKETAEPEVTRIEPEFIERRVRLRKRLRPEAVAESTEPVRQSRRKTQDSELIRSIRRSRPQVEVETAREEKPKPEVSQPRASRREEKAEPEVTTSTPVRALPEKLPEVAQPANNSNTANSATEEKTKDYNNAYIDPTDYNAAATGSYQAPNSVVVTERSSGCRTILGAGQGVSTGFCAKTPETPSRNQRVADGDNKPAPNWLRRSQNADLAIVPRVRHQASGENNRHWRNPLPVASSDTPTSQNNRHWRRPLAAASNNTNQRWRPSRVASSDVPSSGFRSNRFIPHPSEFSPTRISATPIPSIGGTLPAPMADGNVAPRPSTVAYDFPLASTLPQIPYSGTVAYAGNGMMFPLSIPAPITSLFGWRIHPITGDRRFHSGTDLGAPMGTPVLAAAKGQVEIADWVGGYGLTVIINHTGAQQTLYGHMSELFVQPGQWVNPGTVIGRVGSTGNSTGPHLHFEVRNLTQNGWVATDPGTQLQASMSQLVQVLRTAQVPQQPGS
ncbi:MAG: peptidoglycan DD-metalloendopeptidase family protein [Gloeotrichia echinulata IR180]|jgi:murein DD-endopeptidase MepM/ murein hydrolase activator NlpD